MSGITGSHLGFQTRRVADFAVPLILQGIGKLPLTAGIADLRRLPQKTHIILGLNKVPFRTCWTASLANIIQNHLPEQFVNHTAPLGEKTFPDRYPSFKCLTIDDPEIANS